MSSPWMPGSRDWSSVSPGSTANRRSRPKSRWLTRHCWNNRSAHRSLSPPPKRRFRSSRSPPEKSWEQVLAENWLVWLGGLALALGGGFLVKLSIDYGLLTPSVRVVLGVLLGVGLALAGDWVARREPAPGLEETTPSYVPQALAAAGAATVFASLYAAYQLYELLPAGLAFPLLAGTAAATVVISLRHGPLVAALGLVGAYFVPLLVETDTA